MDHSVKEYLDDNEQVLVSEEHQVFQRRVYARFGRSINVRAGMRKQMEELDEPTNSK